MINVVIDDTKNDAVVAKAEMINKMLADAIKMNTLKVFKKCKSTNDLQRNSA